jgi:hypothetical protein
VDFNDEIITNVCFTESPFEVVEHNGKIHCGIGVLYMENNAIRGIWTYK